MEESENIIIGVPEQGGDVLNIRLIEDEVDIAIGGTSYGAVQLMVYDGTHTNLIAMVDVKKMDPEEAPDYDEPYLVVAWDPSHPDVRVERVVDAKYC